MSEWAGDPAGFGMQVEHGGFEAVMAQNNLQIAHRSAPLQGMCGIRVAQTVRGEPIQLATLCCRFDRPLDIGFVAAPAHQRRRWGAWVAAQDVGGKEPSPALGASRIRVFFGQKTGQGHRNMVGVVLGRPCPGQIQLVFQGWDEAVGEEHDSSLVALRLVDVKAALFEVEILDAQVQGFADAQTTAVEEVDEEAGGITVVRPLSMEALLYFVGAAVLAVPTTALICRARLARQRRASFGTVLIGAVIAALIAYIGILIYVGGADVFTAAFWNDPKQSPTLERFLLGWLGTALPCALVALAVVAYYQSRRKHEKDVA